MIRKWLAVFSTLLILISTQYAFAEKKEEPGEFPELNEDGFLDKGEFIWIDDENGIWRYASSTLRVEIFRREQIKPKRIWYEAEFFCTPGNGPRMIANDPEFWKNSNHMDNPHRIARKNGTVLAISSDYAQLRLQKKERLPGIIIRNGQILARKTKVRGAHGFPVLDCLAIWPDGDMKVYYCDEKTAEEYIEEGAIDVLSFGPILIRDGVLNESALNYGTSHAQRVAVGMVEKGHYWFMMLEGRIARSPGDGIRFLAERLMEKGCTLGFNMDGGDTACIVFMGHQICKLINGKKNRPARRTSDILGVGYSEQLPSLDDPW